MSKGKKAGIIVGCIVAIIAIVVIVKYLPMLIREDSQEPEHIAVSAYNLTKELLDPELTSLQREELWKQYEGKQVKWTNELKSVTGGEENLVAYFLNPLDYDQTEVKAAFDGSQRSSLLELKEDDLVIYTGVLTSYGESCGDAEICLRDCAVVSLITLEFLWWNSELEDTYSIFGETDADFIYALVFPNFYRVYDEGYVRMRPSSTCSEMALNRVSGGIASSQDLGYRWCHFRDLSKKSYNYEGVIYKSVHCAVYAGIATMCDTLQAIDQETGSVLWMKTFQGPGMNDLLIADGILYLSTDEGIGAFELPHLTELQNQNSSETVI